MITGKILVDALKHFYNVSTDLELAKKINKNAATVGNWQRGKLTATIARNVFSCIINNESNNIKGDEFITYVKKRTNKSTDTDIINFFGITGSTLTSWKKKGLKSRSVYDIVEKSKKAHIKTLIVPIIEYFPINKTSSKQGKNSVVLNNTNNTFIKELIAELNRSYGIYTFYDSRGRAVYVGKAKEQTLWKEINSAFNRERGDSQIVRKVTHPSLNEFNATKERHRQITRQAVKLHDLAVYFSAYKTEKTFTNNLEAILIRMFPNDLLNTKVERIK